MTDILRRALVLAIGLAVMPISPALAAPVPNVGCPSTGQLGPQAAPALGAAVDVPGPDAARLANYVMADGTRTLAPRGWHCRGLYGSDGSVLFVAPDVLTVKSLVAGRAVTSPAIVARMASGGTSGRYEVARVAAMLFPAAARFVADVEADGIDGPFRHGLPPGDRVTRLGPFAALYTTPAQGRGVGTRSAFAPRALPVDGIAAMDSGEDHDLNIVDIRLPAAMRPLVAAVIADLRRSFGLPGRSAGR